MSKPVTVLLLCLLLAACSSCGAATSHTSTRTVTAQYNAAVAIRVTCPDGIHGGTGVLVSENQLLTADHVVRCQVVEGFPIFMPPTKIEVDPGDGNRLEAFIEISYYLDDIARLRLVGDASLAKYFTPIHVGEMPGLGTRVCESSMIPRPTYRCGTVQIPTDEHIKFEMRTEHGNSGSGLYDSSGRLVGIVVRLWLCEAGEMCGGYAIPLSGREWLLP